MKLFGLPLSVLIGLRYTRASRRGGMLSFLSTMSMAGLVLGVSLLVIVLSVMNGFERELRDRILGLMPQGSIYRAGGIEDWNELSAYLEQKDGVSAAAPFVEVHALLSYRNETAPALIYGIDVDREKRVSQIASFVSEAILKELADSGEKLLIGRGIAEKLNLSVGTKLMVVAPAPDSISEAKFSYFSVLGIIDTESELDQSLVVANWQSLASLRSKDRAQGVDGIRLKFDRLDEAPRLSRAISRNLGPIYYQSNWQRTHGNLYHAIQVSKRMVGLLMSLIVALAAFNVVSTLVLVVTEKQSSVAILRTLGASSGDIQKIFMTLGLLIGAGGLALGLVLGVGVVLVIEPMVRGVESLTGFQFLYSDVYPLTKIPAEIQPADLIMVTLVASVLIFLATILPARKAAKLQPADILRYE